MSSFLSCCRLQPLLRQPVKMRIALHRHTGAAGVMEAAEEILRAVPGIELVDLEQPAVGFTVARGEDNSEMTWDR